MSMIVHPVMAASKPRPPITVSVVPVQGAATVQTPRANEPRGLEVLIHSTSDVREATATIECADGAVLVQGPLEWKGPLSGRMDQRIPISVRPSPSGKGRVRVTVVVAGAAGPAFTAQAAYSFTSAGVVRQKASPRQPGEKNAVHKDRSGRDVVEHPAR